MACVKIIDNGKTFDTFTRIHQEHGDMSKFEFNYTPQNGMCGKVIWEGMHPTMPDYGEIYLVALRNGKNVVIAKDGTEPRRYRRKR